ncbi:MAG: hypothetical protein JWM58_3405 [Rhizobium sp.]|nr:hypothetical protein [Rhizobium sp.]
MAMLPIEAQSVRPAQCPTRMDAFGMFLAGFILVYAATSIGLEHIIGIVGFAKAPYLSAVTYLYALGFIALGLVFNRVAFRFAIPHPLAIVVLSALFMSVVAGISNHNASQYIIGWTLYLITGVLAFQFFRNPRTTLSAESVVKTLFSLPFLALVLFFAFISIFNKDNDYQYVLFEVIALYAILLRSSMIDKALGMLLYLCIHLGSNDGFVQVEINRASILAVGAVGLLYMLYRKHLVMLFFLIFATIGGLLYALSLDDAVVDDLPRNIKEAILLMKGDDIYNHTSSYQRVYEGQKVMEDYQDATDAEWLFGKGLGRTVDMTGAADKTPGQHALLGATEVHNIHFLHFAVFHKFGLVGLAILAAFGGGLIWMFATDLGMGRLTSASMFFYFYLFYNFVFAFPASNFLIANPLWPAFLGMLCFMRARQAAPCVNRVASPALTGFIPSGRS